MFDLANGFFNIMQELYICILELHQCLLWLVVASSNLLKPVWSSLVCMGLASLRFRTLSMQMCCWIVDLTYVTL